MSPTPTPTELPTAPCPICCHETRNAMAAVTYFARQVQRHHPGLAPAMLTASLARLDKALARCADANPTAPGHRR